MEPRNPKNLQDLLKFAIQHQKNDTSCVQELDAEKKQFLENVLDSMTVDVMQELLTAIRILDNNTSTNEEKNECLNIIRDYIDNIDFANSFIKIGGTDVLMKCARNADVSVRANAYNVLAELAQNNPYSQQHFVICNVMEVLVSSLSDENDIVVASSLYALSSLVNNFEPAAIEFSKGCGIAAVLRCLSSKCSRVFTKACFLISSLSSQFPIIRDAFENLRSFEMLAENLEVVTDFDVKTEALIIAIAALTGSKNFSTDSTLRKNVTDILQCTINNIKGLPQCEEMLEYSYIILKNLN